MVWLLLEKWVWYAQHGVSCVFSPFCIAVYKFDSTSTKSQSLIALTEVFPQWTSLVEFVVLDPSFLAAFELEVLSVENGS